MAVWSTSYEANPRNFNNPGEGAYHFRDFKTAVRQRGTLEHIWGDDEQTLGDSTGGEHKEGSARVLVTDAGSVLRPTEERFTSTTKPGRIEVDMSILSTLREQDEADLQEVAGHDYTDQMTKEIKVASATILGSNGTATDPTDPTVTSLYTIFKYDDLVDIIQDQLNIRGIKKFITSPRVPNVADAGAANVLDGWEDFLDLATVDEKLAAVNVDEVFNSTTEAKRFNVFDPDDEDNADNIVADADSPSVNASVVTDVIRAADIYGTTVRGAVWG